MKVRTKILLGFMVVVFISVAMSRVDDYSGMVNDDVNFGKY